MLEWPTRSLRILGSMPESSESIEYVCLTSTQPDPPDAGCVDEAVERACHRVEVRPVPVLPDESQSSGA
jgi:hypothetical protein